MLSLHYVIWIPSVLWGISGELDLGKCGLTCQNFCSLEEVFWMLLSVHVGVIPWLITLFLGIYLSPFLFIDFFRWLWHKRKTAHCSQTGSTTSLHSHCLSWAATKLWLHAHSPQHRQTQHTGSFLTTESCARHCNWIYLLSWCWNEKHLTQV